MLEPGQTEIESRYGRLVGGEDAREDDLLVEVAHHFSKRFYGGFELATHRDPNGSREIESFGVEAIVSFGKVAGIQSGVLVEYAANRHGRDALETKLLLEKPIGELDARLNLIAEKELRAGGPLEFAYAASADIEVADEFRLGVMALGELGSSRHLTTHGEHFVGPNLKYELEPKEGGGELGFELGYLFALGEARDDARGLLRLQVEYGFRF